jgi:glycosyltransferase involved in cell wall biosynthesis
MTILFVHSTADLYGAGRCLLRMSCRLTQEGNQVVVILPHDGPLKDKLEQSGVRVKIHRDLSVISRKQLRTISGMWCLFWRIPLSVLRVLREIISCRPDVVHTNTSLILSPAVAARLARVPHVWHVREFFSEFPKLWKCYQQLICLLADRVVCVSRAVATQFTTSRGRAKILVIHDGFPQREFEPVGEERISRFKEQFQINGGPLIGVVGRIKFKRKGQEVFVHAVALLKERFPEARFAVVGSPYPGNEEHLERLVQLIHELGVTEQVIYTGDVEDIKAALSSLDICVLSSAQPEPFGGVVIESMALGKPVVGTRIGGTVEQIDDGVTGILVAPNNPVELATAIDKLLSNPALCREMGTRAREAFLNRFEFEPLYRQTLDLYSRLFAATNCTAH